MNDKTWTEARAIAARHDAGQADDLAQDLAVAALENRGSARSLGAWLERVGRNVAIDRWRVERRRRELTPEIDAPAPLPDPETVLLGRERRRLVRRALGALPRPQRQAALARFHGGLSFDDVARRLGTPVVTARTRVHRALAGLRARLGVLRAWFIWPGVHATALGVALLATNARGLSSSRPRSCSVPPPALSWAVRRRVAAPTKAAASAKPAPAPSVPTPVPATSTPATTTSTPPPPARLPAREPRGARAPAPSDSVPGRRVFVFGDDVFEGETIGPEGEHVRVVPTAVHASLIEIRRQFLAEVLKSLEDL